jgi:pimeloyl-ACP methyl ester carboxylesterase
MTFHILKAKIPPAPNAPELELLRNGTQAAILFVHGANCRASVWLRLMDALRRRGIQSAAVDLRGHGRSGGKDELQRAGIEDYVEDVLRALDVLPETTVLTGHSMGGLITQLVAERRSLAGLALVASSPAGGMRNDGLRMFARHPIAFLGAMRRKSFAHLYRNAKTCRSLLFSPHTAESVITEFMTSLGEESWRAGNEMNTLLPKPEKVKCPVLVVGGDDDFMVSRQSVYRTARAYGTVPVFIPKAGHMIQLEQDLDELAEILSRFVIEATRGAP